MGKILVEQGVKLKLQQETGASQPTIRRALDGKTNTPIARLIRAMAINKFGGTEQMVRKVVIK